MKTNKSIVGVKPCVWLVLALVFALGVAWSAEAATLKLISLKCCQTEDSEVDEALLEIIVDSHRTTLPRKNMKAGDVWYLNKTFTFKNKIQVSLFDIDDWPSPDDWLGSTNIGPTPTKGVVTKIFNREGANYELKYRVDP